VNQYKKTVMVPSTRGTSNTNSDDLFEILEEWNTYLEAEDIDLNSLEARPEPKRHPARRGPSL